MNEIKSSYRTPSDDVFTACNKTQAKARFYSILVAIFRNMMLYWMSIGNWIVMMGFRLFCVLDFLRGIEFIVHVMFVCYDEPDGR